MTARVRLTSEVGGAGAPEARADDTSRTRAAAVNQLLTGAVTLTACIVVVAFDAVQRSDVMLSALGLMFVVTGLALVVPWDKAPPWTLVAVPLLDGLAITMLVVATPGVGIGYLWTLPCVWLASTFGAPGFTAAIVLPMMSQPAAALLSPGSDLQPSLLLVPLTLAVVSAVAFLYARRTRAQRMLLSHQGASLKSAIERIRREEDFVLEILDAVDFGVVRLDAAGTTIVANDAHGRLLAPHRAAQDGPTVFAADGVTPLAPDDDPLARAARGDWFDGMLIWYGAPGTRRRALDVTARPLASGDGVAPGALVVSRDVTDEVTALRAREDLIASVSHELRTPLTSILGYVDLALDADGITPATRGNLEVIERNAERLLRIVADLLAAAAESRDGIALTFHRETVDVDVLVRQAVDAIRAQAASRSITIGVDGIEPASAWIDPLRLRQVVDNLLSNAVKYNHDGGRIEVGVTGDGDHTWIVVRDDGPGIRAEDEPHVFDRFFRSESVRHTSTHGSGLGLAISRDMMRAQGGDISLRTTEGEGSTFIVRVPRPRREE